ncbi:MAG: hypothetical protein ABH834_01515 [Candidatus Altiarchaeota archaeon]
MHGASDNISLETGKFLKNSRQVRVTVNVGGSFSQEKLDSVKDEIKVRQTEFSTTTVFPQTIRAPEGGEKPSKKPLLNNAIILFVVAIALIIAYWKTKKPAGKDK